MKSNFYVIWSQLVNVLVVMLSIWDMINKSIKNSVFKVEIFLPVVIPSRKKQNKTKQKKHFASKKSSLLQAVCCGMILFTILWYCLLKQWFISFYVNFNRFNSCMYKFVFTINFVCNCGTVNCLINGWNLLQDFTD